MSTNDIKINHVSDTALWVAYYRVQESERPDALFRDPLAKTLVGERGQQIAEHMKSVGHYAQWSVVSRTVMIDRFITKLLQEGIDTVINLGAGLDTRPYRMDLPAHLKWIEVDHPQIINLKNETLKLEKPRCQLVRVELDLSVDAERKRFLAECASQSKKILVMTEGVIPYLSEDQVEALAIDLKENSTITYWITEFFNPEVYKYLKTSVRTRKMQNAPFKFYPPDWTGFFERNGWVPKEIRYSSEVAIESGRKMPLPWFAVFFKLFMSEALKKKSMKMAGYMILERK